jgi:hypothetical protein
MQKTKKREESVSPTPLFFILFLAGFIHIVITTYRSYNQYYVGDDLTTVQVTINKKTEYVFEHPNKRNYVLSTVEYKSRFWISEGTIEVVEKNRQLREQILNLTLGDKIGIGIRETDLDNLGDKNYRPRVIELYLNKKKVITANQVESFDNKGYGINYWGGRILFLIGALYFIPKIYRNVRDKIRAKTK